MLTKSQKRDVRSVTGLSMQFQILFDSQWADAVGRLRGSRADLRKIRIISESGGKKDGR